MTTRGTSKFETGTNGHVLYNEDNLEKLRKLFLDRTVIDGDMLGPGDPGDFDLGAWHVLCHLAGGCAVYKKINSMIWVEISHIPLVDLYTATVTVDTDKESVVTFPLLSAAGQALVQNAELVGFVEGSSLGHISARDVKDEVGKFNKWTRQEFDMDEKSENEGGRVWEHWVTVRDLTPSASVGISVLRAYLSMVSLCGGRFTSIVARGRTEYHHPDQLIALIQYGFITVEDAMVDIIPKPIPEKEERLIYSADPGKCVKAISILPWDENNLSYFMYKRRIDKWNTNIKVRNELTKAKLI